MTYSSALCSLTFRFFKLSMTFVFKRSGELSSDFGDAIFFLRGSTFGSIDGFTGDADGDLSSPIIPDSMSMTFSIDLILFSI